MKSPQCPTRASSAAPFEAFYGRHGAHLWTLATSLGASAFFALGLPEDRRVKMLPPPHRSPLCARAGQPQ